MRNTQKNTQIKYLTPEELMKLYETANIIIYDIRETDEFEREHIADAINTPLSTFNACDYTQKHPSNTIVFYCQAGTRTQANITNFKKITHDIVYLLKGGLNAWKKAKYPTLHDKEKRIPIMQQVQITIGTIILISLALGVTLSLYFLIICALIGLGLLIAGFTGYCGLAKLLSYIKN